MSQYLLDEYQSQVVAIVYKGRLRIYLKFASNGNMPID
jgi:hypothetical protein